MMRVLFKSYDSKMASREKLFKAVAEFTTKLGPDRLITITHSEDRDNIVLTVWYWGEQEEKEEKAAKKSVAVKPGSSTARAPSAAPSASPPTEPGAPAADLAAGAVDLAEPVRESPPTPAMEIELHPVPPAPEGEPTPEPESPGPERPLDESW